jgi:hypothetical protein
MLASIAKRIKYARHFTKESGEPPPTKGCSKRPSASFVVREAPFAKDWGEQQDTSDEIRFTGVENKAGGLFQPSSKPLDNSATKAL